MKSAPSGTEDQKTLFSLVVTSRLSHICSGKEVVVAMKLNCCSISRRLIDELVTYAT